MELAILITVNLIISFLVYVAFSVRFRMALDKERQNRVPRAFYDNLQMTIQYINTATATVDEKTTVFQRQLRRSEEILKRLEKANEDFEKNLKKSRRKRKTGDNSELHVPAADQLTSDQLTTGNKPAQSGGASNPGNPGNAYGSLAFQGSDRADRPDEFVDERRSGQFAGGSESEEELSAEGRHMERLLNRMQGDVLQVSDLDDDTEELGTSDADYGSAPRKGLARSAIAESSQIGSGTRLLARIGGFVGRIMGINSQSFAMSSQEEQTAPESKDSAFDREVVRMSRAPGFASKVDARNANMDSAKEPVQPAKGDYFESSAGSASARNSRKDYYVSGFDPEGDSRLSFSGARDKDARQPEAGTESGFGSGNGEPAGVATDVDTMDFASYRNRPPESQGREQSGGPPLEKQSGTNQADTYRGGLSANANGMETDSQGPPPANEQERRITRVQEFLESTGLNLLDTTPQTRAVLIRELGSMGFDPPDIIRATRFPPSEVALVLQLPEEPGDTRRRTRKIPS